MYGYIYLTTNNVNDKKYIGQHRSSTFDKNYFGSGTIFKKALSKYGKNNFSVQILCECETKEELNEKEVYYINLYNAVQDDNFYNTNYGGYRNGNQSLIFVHNPNTNETQLIIPEKLKEYKEKGFVEGMGHRTDEQIQNYKNSWKNNRGTVIITNGLETKYIFESELTEYLSKGYKLGRIPTRPNQKCENRKWVNDGNISLMVSEEKLNEYLSNGYSLGRLKFKSYNRTAPAHNKGKIMIKNDTTIKYVLEQDLNNYLQNGWEQVKK